jgi:hypothetical protein
MNKLHAVPTHLATSNSCWPPEFGPASTSGSSEELRYAYFPKNRRLAVESDGSLMIYDIGDYQFRGLLQAQSAGGAITIMTQRGRMRLSDFATIHPHAISSA